MYDKSKHYGAFLLHNVNTEWLWCHAAAVLFAFLTHLFLCKFLFFLWCYCLEHILLVDSVYVVIVDMMFMMLHFNTLICEGQ